MDTLAFLGDNKQINLWNSSDRSFRQVTYPLLEGDSTPCLWPSWSPDGEWIAYFQPLKTDAPARLCIAQVNGVEMAVLAEFKDRQPMYVHWSPTGKHLAVVEQSPEGLELVVYPVNGSRAIPIDDGAPIFFQWLPNGTGLVAHVVHPVRQTSRVQFYSLEDSNEDWVISEQTGGFCAPLFVQNRVIFAEQGQGETQLKSLSLDTESVDTLCVLNGVLSVQARPNHNQLTIGLSGPQPGINKGIHLLDMDDGTMTVMAENTDDKLTWQSMRWSPDGAKLLVSAINQSQRWFEWQFWDENGMHIINQFLPTREQVFFLHFFDQFVHSHQIISADSERFYFSAYEAPHQRSDLAPRPWVFKGSFEEGGEFEAIEYGLFPVVKPLIER